MNKKEYASKISKIILRWDKRHQKIEKLQELNLKDELKVNKLYMEWSRL